MAPVLAPVSTFVLVAVLSACSSAPTRAPAPTSPSTPAQRAAEAAAAAAVLERDPRAPSLAEIQRLPDPEPRVETIRPRGPNKPYAVAGRTVVPLARDVPFRENGLASWYGRPFHGRRTANGEIFNMYGLSAAHRTLPLPSYARVRNPANGREVIVRVNDRGPFVRSRVMDLSYAAAVKLGFIRKGMARVEIERLTSEDIRTGAWRRRGEEGDAERTAADRPDATIASADAERTDRGAGELGEPVLAAVADGPAAATPATGSDGGADTGMGTAPAMDTAEAANTAPAATPTSTPNPVPDAPDAPGAPPAESAGRFWLQLGAFRQLDGATGFQDKVQARAEWLGPLMTLVRDGALTRLQAGPFATREQATEAAERVRGDLNLVPLVVSR